MVQLQIVVVQTLLVACELKKTDNVDSLFSLIDYNILSNQKQMLANWGFVNHIILWTLSAKQLTSAFDNP